MKVSASTTITVEIGDQRFQLTQQEAEALYASLGGALNKNNSSIFYQPGVRSPIFQDNIINCLNDRYPSVDVTYKASAP